MDYEMMLDHHKATKAAITLATIEVPMEEASRFGVVITDEHGAIKEFEEKPENPRSNKASMGIYIFNWEVLKEALHTLSEQPSCDFGKHIIPYCHERGDRIVSYPYQGYWKDVGTLGSYWEANMELIDIIPEFNLYEEFWKIYTKSDILPAQYISKESKVNGSIIGEGSEIYGEVYNSVIGAGVTIGKGTVVRDSIIMNFTELEENVTVNKSIIAENCKVCNNVELGVFEPVDNKVAPHIYSFGLVVIGEGSYVPPNVKIGQNTAISGVTIPEDYKDGILESGETLIKAGELA